MELSVIVAIAKNHAIGKDNQLLWHISEDLKRFKTITMGAPILMGRKTYESIGRPLPGRRNIVISLNCDLKISGCECVTSIDEAITSCKNEKEVFVIGGGEIYKQTLSLADKLYLTVVDYEYDADTFFPQLDMSQWQEVSREDYPSGEKFPYPYSFINYKRRKE